MLHCCSIARVVIDQRDDAIVALQLISEFLAWLVQVIGVFAAPLS
jgi:hypothetical protein